MTKKKTPEPEAAPPDETHFKAGPGQAVVEEPHSASWALDQHKHGVKVARRAWEGAKHLKDGDVVTWGDLAADDWVVVR